MAKFIDKKQQVYDFELTPYGKYKLSIGTFSPAYYSFYDGEVLYDSKYAKRSDRVASLASENQQNIHKRIKEDTSYIGSLVTFTELENSVPPSPLIRQSLDSKIAELNARADNPLDTLDAGEAAELEGLFGSVASGEEDEKFLNYFSVDLGESPRQDIPSPDIYRFGQPIGNARFDGPTQQSAPAWKLALLQGHISSSFPINLNHDEERIPQLNVKMTYIKRIEDYLDRPVTMNPSSVSQVISTTPRFAGDNVISLVKDDIMAYVEEVNTEILTENFDISVFKIETVPAEKAIAEIFVDSESCPTAGELITINDGLKTVVFEFVAAGGTPSTGDVGVELESGDDRECDGCMGRLNAAINSSELNVTTSWTADPEFKRNNYAIITIWNHNEHRPWQWTNHKLTETMVNGFVKGFTSGSVERELLHPKKFTRTNPQIVDGMMMYPTAPDVHMYGNNDPLTLTTSSVEYYFDIFTDAQIDQKQACRGAELFNKDSYYIDLEFECEREKTCTDDDDDIFYDIYGAAIEDPEICEDD